MLCHREVVVCFDRPYLIAISSETVQIDAEGLRITGDIYYFVYTVTAEHCNSLVVYSDARRIDNDHIRLFRNLIQFFFYIKRMAVCE